jgi:hypothetical protein
MEGGKLTLTTDPIKVKKSVTDYFYGHLGGKTDQTPEHIPPWLTNELSHKDFTGTYTLDAPFTTQEMHKSLTETKNSASPGKDGLPITVLK